MTPRTPPPFNPTRVPPCDGDKPRTSPRLPVLSVEEAHYWLGHAWAAYDRARANPEPYRKLVCRDPGCAENCAQCGLQCAIIVGVLWGAYNDYQDALAAAGPVLSFSGAVYSVMAGRA